MKLQLTPLRTENRTAWRLWSLKTGLLLLLALFGVLVGQSAQSQERYAVLFASGTFDKAEGELPELTGTLTDVKMMASLLVLKFGYDPHHILIVGASKQSIPGFATLRPDDKENRFTRQSFYAAMNWLSGKLHAADSIGCIYYTGHGGRFLDADRRDSKGFTFYFVTSNRKPVYDFELRYLIEHGPLSAHPLSVLLDCCFAGSAARSGGIDVDLHDVVPKFVPDNMIKGEQNIDLMPDVKKLKAEMKRDGSLNRPFPTDGLHTMLMASRYDQEASEMLIKMPAGLDTRASVFTTAFYQTALRLTKTPTGNDLVGMVLQRLTDPDWIVFKQTPKQAGDPDRMIIAPLADHAEVLPMKNAVVPVGALAGVQIGDRFRPANNNGAKTESGVKTEYVVKGRGWFHSNLVPKQQDMVPKENMPQTGHVVPSSRLAPGITLGGSPKSKGDGPGGDGAGGDTPAVDTELVDKIVAFDGSPQKSISVSDIYQKTTAGPAKIAHASTPQEKERIKEQVAIAATAFERLKRMATGAHPLGLKLSLEGRASATYAIGETIWIRVQSCMPGNLVLIGADPDGSISVLAPDQGHPNAHLEANTAKIIRIFATPPGGVTHLYAFLFPLNTKQWKLPLDVFEPEPPSKEGQQYLSWRIPTAKASNFLDWLREQTEAEFSRRDTATPVADDAVDVDRVNLTVLHEGEKWQLDDEDDNIP